MNQRRSGWGGARAGAGRKPKGEVAGVSHTRRKYVDARFPVFVTVSVLPRVGSLRSAGPFRVLLGAIAASGNRLGLRVREFRVQDHQLELFVQARDTRSLARGMQGLSVRVARSLNRLMSSKGKVFSDRYEARTLRTMAEARDALRTLRGRSR